MELWAYSTQGRHLLQEVTSEEAMHLGATSTDCFSLIIGLRVEPQRQSGVAPISLQNAFQNSEVNCDYILVEAMELGGSGSFDRGICPALEN